MTSSTIQTKATPQPSRAGSAALQRYEALKLNMAKRGLGKRPSINFRSLEIYRYRPARQAFRFMIFISGICTLIIMGYITSVPVRSTTVYPVFDCPKPTNDTPPYQKARALIITYPRSGSSFLGDLFQSHPQAFYHFEPLHFLGGFVHDHLFKKSEELLQNLFKCDIPPSFLRWVWDNINFHTLRRSHQYWNACSIKPNSPCYNMCFLKSFCANQTIQIAKTIRLPMRGAFEYLALDDRVRIIHLVRDPRGTMNSRSQRDISAWCQKDLHCKSSQDFCRLVEDDLEQGCAIKEQYPDRYMLVRYEDLSLYPQETTKEMLRFLGIEEVPPEMLQFLDSHTQFQHTAPSFLSPPYTTSRNSTQAAFAWSEKMKFSEVLEVQKNCMSVIDKLNYPIVETPDNLSIDSLVNHIQKAQVKEYCPRK